MSEPVNSLIKTVQPDRPTGPNPKKPADESDKQVRDIEKDEVFLIFSCMFDDGYMSGWRQFND